MQHLIVVDNTEECRLTKLLAEEAGKREKLVRSYKADMERIHLECIAYKQQVDKLKRELDDERTKYAVSPTSHLNHRVHCVKQLELVSLPAGM